MLQGRRNLRGTTLFAALKTNTLIVRVQNALGAGARERGAGGRP